MRGTTLPALCRGVSVRMPKSCCAYGCTNHNMMTEFTVSFHKFPDKTKQRDRWNQWLDAVGRVNEDLTPWEPRSRYTYVCGAHFITGKVNSDPLHPDYVPSIFVHQMQKDDSASPSANMSATAKRQACKEKMDNERLRKQPKLQRYSRSLIRSIQPGTGQDREAPCGSVALPRLALEINNPRAEIAAPQTEVLLHTRRPEPSVTCRQDDQCLFLIGLPAPSIRVLHIPQQQPCKEEEVLADQQLCKEEEEVQADQQPCKEEEALPADQQFCKEEEILADLQPCKKEEVPVDQQLCEEEEVLADQQLCKKEEVPFDQQLCKEEEEVQADQQPCKEEEELPADQQLCKEEEEEEEVLADQQHCDQERNSSLYQKEPESPQIKEEQQELCISQEGEQLVLKQDTDTVMVTPTHEERDHSEAEPTGDECLLHNSPVVENRDQKESNHVNTGATKKAEQKPKKRHDGNRSDVNNGDKSPTSGCDSDTGQQYVKCDVCGKSFKYESEKHYRIHTGEKPYSWKTCGKGFSHSSVLTVHTRSHTGEKPYLCKTCGTRFSGMTTWKRHLRIHTDERPYSCETCETIALS